MSNSDVANINEKNIEETVRERGDFNIFNILD